MLPDVVQELNPLSYHFPPKLKLNSWSYGNNHWAWILLTLLLEWEFVDVISQKLTSGQVSFNKDCFQDSTQSSITNFSIWNVTVKFMYLKPNAVPSRKVKKLVEHPRLLIPSTAPLPPALRDHTYSYRRFVAKSRRMCAVYGCSSRAGNGISLHSFPPKNDKRYKAWISALKFGKTPSKNAKVCNLHFTGANYYLGKSNNKT